MTEKTMPVNVLNYSSLTQLLRNPLIFKLKEILGIYTGKKGVSGMVGSACHEALRVYYGGAPEVELPDNAIEKREYAMKAGYSYLDSYPDSGIRYWKLGSREVMIQFYAKAMQVYLV